MSTLPAPGTYAIDLHTHAGFTVKHFGLVKVRGEFTDVEGTIVIAETPTDSSVTATITTVSFNSRDESRDAHVKSPDFLDVEQFPTITFTSTSVKSEGDDWVVEGDLRTVRPLQPDPRRGPARDIAGRCDQPMTLAFIAAYSASSRAPRSLRSASRASSSAGLAATPAAERM